MGGVSDGSAFIVAATIVLTVSFACCVSATVSCTFSGEISSELEQAFSATLRREMTTNKIKYINLFSFS